MHFIKFITLRVLNVFLAPNVQLVGDVELAAAEGGRLPSPETPLDFDDSS